ncbi:hypothetical protein AVI51_01610 [Piscirickettsia salmonis]|uniref:IQ calmodulin-binding motif-containing protein n=1 Tax=Piscirickettsia salmonis TaxID=1238 RepID=UPI00094A3E9E|nr:IQ calmodulin-binding motif-containing protein [Piscirickettsia salmonis]APS49705.1 hypothetical protein AVI50_01655 [Piscirickettsia salmonis]APS52886.1 hypothetical protein AVI51_01610 [Piscirickettsia salmonis]
MPKQEEAALKIQSFFRRYQTQKKFRKPSPTQLEKYKTFAVGNDPFLQVQKLSKPNANYAIVGTGALRNLSITHELSSNDLGVKPHIFIVDNSSDVHKFWFLVKELFQQSESLDDFFRKLPQSNLVRSNSFLDLADVFTLPAQYGCDINSYPNQKLVTYFRNLWLDNETKFTWTKSLV